MRIPSAVRSRRPLHRVGAVLLAIPGLGLGGGAEPAAPRRAVPPADVSVHVLALGDVTLGRYVGATIAGRGGDFAYPFAGLAPDLRAADLGIANLEGVLQADPPPFRAPAALLDERLIGDIRAAPALAGAGLNVVDLANNHVLDGGPAALAATEAALAAAGVTAVGAGADPVPARAPRFLVVHGLRVALLARSAVPNNPPPPGSSPTAAGPALIDPGRPADLAALAADLRAARAGADMVILLMHWGVEYRDTVAPAQRQVAAVAAAAGVDLVIGAHPHVAAPVELLGARPTLVAWSLGNAVFDQQSAPDLREGLALDARFDARGLLAADVRPLWRAGIAPRLVSPADAHGQDVLARVAPASSPALRARQLVAGGPGSYALRPALAYRRPAAPPPLTADLVGDGRAETVALAGARLTVRRARAPALTPPLWQTPPDWRVDGFALGNADTRPGPEIAFTVWKPPAPTEIHAAALRGQIRQHFFLFGWRRGAINPVWNSSALPAPFRAFTFGPPAADGTARLVGLESSYTAPAGPVAVVVWTWNGFGYSLDWRSAERLPAQTLCPAGDAVVIQ